MLQRALVIVDVQNDFTPGQPGGALAVPDGDQVIPVINRLMPKYHFVVATQDWHPPGHQSFASQHPGREVGDRIEWQGIKQTLWPDHCVQETVGAEFCTQLNVHRVDEVVRKGMDENIDSYSGFFYNGHRNETELRDWLASRAVEDVDVVGLATDYCVQFTVLDAIRAGFGTHVIVDACRGVDLQPGDCERALQRMRDAGAELINLAWSDR